MAEEEENIEVLEGMEFDHVKKTCDYIKRAIKQVEDVAVDGKVERLESIKKELTDAIAELKKFTAILNAQHYLVKDLKEKSEDITKSL